MAFDRRVLAALALVLTATACGASTDDGDAAAPPPVAAADSLRGVCPDNVIVQMNWFPQAEHGGLYRLLGHDFKVDSARKAVEGPLLDDGKDTGVRLQVRAGGPVTGFQRVTALMAADQSITLGSIATDEAMQEAGNYPTLAVFAPLDKSPQMIMWSEQHHPDWKSIADIGRTDTTVVYAANASYMDYLLQSGTLKRSQVDASYDGAPARFVSADGAIAQQGYATNEPYHYENEVAEWQRPVRFGLVHDSGYPIYPETLSIPASEKEHLTPCLRKLVPLLQRSTVAYIKDPVPTNDALVRMVTELNAGAKYSVNRAKFAVGQMKDLGLSNDGVTPVVGDFDMQRVTSVMEKLAPVRMEKGRPLPGGLTPERVATNDFIDTKVTW